MTDEQIIAEIKNGNEALFREIITRYESQVASTIIGMLGKSTEAEDIGQEVFIRFYNALYNFRGDSSIGTYLTRIAINLSINALKRRKKHHLLFKRQEGNETELSEPMEKGINDIEMERIVQAAIQKLPRKQRAALVLRLIDGYSTKETARILNIPVGTVLSRLSRAQDRLKILLRPYLKEEIE